MNECDMLERQYTIVENERDRFKELYDDVADENRRLRAKIHRASELARAWERDANKIGADAFARLMLHAAEDLTAALEGDHA